ncbi:50S ribosomal protein L6 [Oscillatoria sp. FACHB-1406]|uniref:50S ribosomal protein L6 n=1 Tax=Oscillatoria sp. FACHB-1406 TaxID=2692846 RepID=UPI0016881175|nr:50S ribosomal protein L6 [Oscillatoria sp. FACHB-1406]MBD2576185.1 50S ribosomal protein L6 [Oscillatoria sp. FACHB-1406]
MSRIGKRPIDLPDKVTVEIDGQNVTVKGPKGQLARTLTNPVSVEQDGNLVKVLRRDESRLARQRHGLSRTLVANMIEGVSKGYTKQLEIQGVGYRAQMQGKNLVLNVGYSHPVEIEPPEGIQLDVPKDSKGLQITISGIDKEVVGNIAAKIRSVRPPEVYKGKGIRYQGEVVRRKAGKTGKGGKK